MKKSSNADLKEPIWLITILAEFIQIIRLSLLKQDYFANKSVLIWLSLVKMAVIRERKILFQ